MNFWGHFAGESIPNILFLILMIGLYLLPFVLIAGMIAVLRDGRRRWRFFAMALILFGLGVLLSYIKQGSRSVGSLNL